MKTRAVLPLLRHAALPLLLAALLGQPQPCRADVPQAINYQAIARKADGTPISNQAVKVRATILRTSASGTIVYQEVLNATTSAAGQFSVKIGTGVLVQGNFTTIDWINFLHFVKIEIDPVGGNAFTDMGTQQMLSVPYALAAKTAQTTPAVLGTAGRVPYFDTNNSLGDTNLYYYGGYFGLGDPTPAYYLDVAGTIRSQTNLRADDNVIAGGDVAASGNLTVGGTGGITGALTVNGGKGVLYNAKDGTNLKVYRFTTGTFTAILGGHAMSAEGSLGFGGGFTSPPTLLVGDIDLTGGTAGELYRVQLVTYNVTNNSCKVRLLNTSPNAVNYTITWNCVAIGN